jgi:hypothetical protein
MRMLAIVLLTASQFTVIPFVASVVSNDAQRDRDAAAFETVNVTVVHKTTL